MVKVGDMVRALRNATDITKGTTYEVVSTSGKQICIRDDVGDNNWCLFEDDCEPADGDELTALRAWKASAIARFPALEEPETDVEAAERFADLSYEEGRAETFLQAFKWARANNR